RGRLLREPVEHADGRAHTVSTLGQPTDRPAQEHNPAAATQTKEDSSDGQSKGAIDESCPVRNSIAALRRARSANPISALTPNIPKGMKQYFFGFLVKGEKRAQTPPKEELDQLMQKHLAYIRSQAEAVKYALAGPFLDNDGIRGIAIIIAASAEEARNIASSESMVQR